MSNFNVRLRLLRNQAGMSQQELADKIGVSKSSINMYERGEREPGIETLEAIADYFNVDMDYLIGNSAHRNKYAWLKSVKENISEQTAKSVRIPVLGSVAAGVPIDAIENIVDWEEIPESMAKDGEYFGVIIQGDSMEPRICDGDIAIVRVQPDVESGEIAIVLINGENGTCKKILKDNRGLTLVSFNPRYDPMFFTCDDVETLPVVIRGKVVKFIVNV